MTRRGETGCVVETIFSVKLDLLSWNLAEVGETGPYLSKPDSRNTDLEVGL